MSNKEFLNKINEGFQIYLKTGARSNEKLKVLHKFVAETILKKLGTGYSVKSLGIGDGKEGNIEGRYNDKNVDILILKNSKETAGIAVKFVMSNYSQNSNNYFENMLGETANIRCKNIPYFQILILTQNAPYFENGGNITKLEEITKNNLHKYQILATDNIDCYLHSPNKTLLYLVKLTENIEDLNLKTKEDYKNYFANNSEFETCEIDGVSFENNVIFNDFETFIEKISHQILGI